MHQTNHLQHFNALCRECGPALFQFHVGRDADHDPLWCTQCGHEYQWHEADAYWLETAEAEEPAPVATSEPFSQPRQPVDVTMPTRKALSLPLALVATLLLGLLLASLFLPVIQGSLPKTAHRHHPNKTISVGS